MANTFPPLISASSYDAYGLKQLVGDESSIIASCVIKDNPLDAFLHPMEMGLEGFAFDGTYRVGGAVSPPQGLATWFTETPGECRGAKAAFPLNGLALVTSKGLSIYDYGEANNTLNVWMVFKRDNLNAMLESMIVPASLSCGDTTFVSSNNTISREIGSWFADEVQTGMVLNFTLFPTLANNRTYTVVEVISPLTIQVQESVVDAVDEQGYVTYTSTPNFIPNKLQYVNGVLTINYSQSLDLNINFVLDRVYADIPMIAPAEPPSTTYDVTGWRVSTLAGNYGIAGYVNGLGLKANLVAPSGLAIGSTNMLYVLENEKIRQISPNGLVFDFIGQTMASFDDGNKSLNGPVATAKIGAYGNGMAKGADGHLYFSDENRSIRKVGEELVSTIAGPNFQLTFDPLDQAHLFYYNIDTGVSIDAGTMGVDYPLPPPSWYPSDATTLWKDGVGVSARFHLPTGVGFDSYGAMWVADRHCIRKVIPTTGAVTTPYGKPYSKVNFFGTTEGYGNLRNPDCDIPNPPTITALSDTSQPYTGIDVTFNYALTQLDATGVETAASFASLTLPVVGGSVEYRLITLPTASAYAEWFVLYVNEGGSSWRCLSFLPATDTQFIDNGSIATNGPPYLYDTILDEAVFTQSWGPARFNYAQGIGVDASTNVFVTDELQGIVSKLYGSPGYCKSLVGNFNRLYSPAAQGMAVITSVIPSLEAPTIEILDLLGSWPDAIGTEIYYALSAIDSRGVETPVGGWSAPWTVGSTNFIRNIIPPTVSSATSFLRLYVKKVIDGAADFYYGVASTTDYAFPLTVDILDSGGLTTNTAIQGLTQATGPAHIEGPVGIQPLESGNLLILDSGANCIFEYNVTTSRLTRIVGEMGGQVDGGQGDGIDAAVGLSTPFYITPGRSPGAYYFGDWGGETVKSLEHGTWSFPITYPQTENIQIGIGTAYTTACVTGDPMDSLSGLLCKKFSISLQAGQGVKFTLIPGLNFGSTLTLYDEFGISVATSELDENNYPALTYLIPANGTYELVANMSATSFIPPYRFTLTVEARA